ncbi:MAG: NADPH-dependent F420 reductase [Acidimicrobiia bacterium]
MRIGVLGTGIVGQTLGRRLVELGHEVRMGSRSAGNEKAAAWVAEVGEGASEGTFTEAAAFGDLLVNATNGNASLEALEAAGAANLAGKVLVDVSNALDTSQGMPPAVGVGNADSLGERIQRAFPEARVVKTLNTMNCSVMVDPTLVPGSHTVFVCGDDEPAKGDVRRLLAEFGWPPGDVLDLGGIASARGVEMYVALWVQLWMTTGTGQLNVKVVVGA